MKRLASFLTTIGFVFSLVLTFLASVPVHTPEAEAAFGISPPWVRNTHMLPGSGYDASITLSTNNPEQDMMVKTEVTGDRELKKWVEIENQENLIMPKGASQFKMKVRVDVPKRAGIGEYKGNIAIRLEPVKKSNTGGVAIALGANAEIDIVVVGDEVVDYKVATATVDSFSAGDPMVVDMAVENHGNKALDNFLVEAQVWDQSESNMLFQSQGNKLLQTVDPYERRDVQMLIPFAELQKGQYWVRLSAYKDGEIIYKTKIFLIVDPSSAEVKAAAEAEARKAEAAQGPRIPSTDDSQAPEVAEGEAPVPVADAGQAMQEGELRAAAPATDNSLLILAIAGVAFGGIAMIALLVVVVVLMKRKGGK